MAAGKPSALDERRAQFARYKEDVKARGKPFYPFAMFEDTVMSLVVVTMIVALAVVWKWTSWSPHHDGTHQGLLGPEFTAPADPGTTNFVPRPDWYFYFLFYLLRVFKWPESVFLGTVGVPTIALILLIALPFYDVRRERRLSRRPVAVVGLVLTILSMGILTWKGATASEALASEVIADVPHWISAQKLPPAAVARCEALRGRGLYGLPYVPRHRLLQPRGSRPHHDRHAQPRHRFPDPPPAVPVVRESGLADAEVRLARHETPAPAGRLPRSFQRQAVTNGHNPGDARLPRDHRGLRGSLCRPPARGARGR